MALLSSGPEADAFELAQEWLSSFEGALEAGDRAGLEPLLAPAATWRDFLAFSWDIKTTRGAGAIAGMLSDLRDAVAPRNFRIKLSTPPVLSDAGGLRIVTALYEFDCAAGPGAGCFLLAEQGGGDRGFRVSAISTQLEGLREYPESTGHHRPDGKTHGIVMGRESWAEKRQRETGFLDREPQVVILGAGQAGLMLAARLRQLNVDTLLVERNARVGDNWRNRYSTLATHDVVKMDHFAYMPFPPTWPQWTPKDKIGDFFEYYASAMELNVWTGSSVVATGFHPDRESWTIEVARGDGTTRVVRPRHFVSATGMNGIPRVIHFQGESGFAGKIVHSDYFGGGREWAGKNVVVLGGGVSGNDIIQDCYEQGANVALVQRSTTNVIAIHSFHSTFMPVFMEDGPHHEDGDIIADVLPYDLQIAASAELQKVAEEKDAALRAALAQAGFGLDSGINADGPASAFRSGRNSYYFDIGASSLIAERKVPVHQGVTIERLTEDSAVLSDGTVLKADLIVTATGYGTTLEAARPIIGDEIADKCLPVYQLGEDGEMQGVWRRSGQDGLWFMLGTLQQSRFYSKFLALQIKAVEEGILPYSAEVDRTVKVSSYPQAGTVTAR